MNPFSYRTTKTFRCLHVDQASARGDISKIVPFRFLKAFRFTLRHAQGDTAFQLFKQLCLFSDRMYHNYPPRIFQIS